MDDEIGAASADGKDRSNVCGRCCAGDHEFQRHPTSSLTICNSARYGVEHLLGAMAGDELVQNALLQDIANVLADVEHQLQHNADGDGIVAGSVGPDNAVSKHGHMVQMREPNGVDQACYSLLGARLSHVRHLSFCS